MNVHALFQESGKYASFEARFALDLRTQRALSLGVIERVLGSAR